jgi:hypothetical protein
MFNFPLRIDANHLEELADAEVEGLFIHGNLRSSREVDCAPTLRSTLAS